MRRQLALLRPNRMLNEDFFDSFFDRSGFGEISNVEVDLYEDEKDNVVAEFNNLSGFGENNLDISLEDNVLTVTGTVEEKNEEEDKKKKYYHKEIRHESFCRSVSLPVKVKGDAIDAKLEKGKLVVTMPKADEVKPKKISIKAS